MGGENRKGKNFYGLLIFFLFTTYNCIPANAQQIFINEIQSSNVRTIFDHTGDTPDWIEIYNGGNSAIDLLDYGLSDVDSLPLKWTFPSVVLRPQAHLLVFASGLNLKETDLYWETIIDVGDEWKYIVPNSEPPASWKISGFDDSGWLEGKSGFGYGDSDDSTVINNVLSVFIRKKFDVSDKSEIAKVFLHMDYDDGFVAYLNGNEIARSGLGVSGSVTAFDRPADSEGHEALLHQGRLPEGFLIDPVSQFLVNGENVLAIQIHNTSIYSSDLTAIPFFTLGKTSPANPPGKISKYIDLVPKHLHTNFKISSEGEAIILSSPDGSQIDSVYTPPLNADVSLGRKPDGSQTFRFFAEPTPGKANLTKDFFPASVDTVVFSVPGGFFKQPLFVGLLTSSDTDSIYFTLDGSEPGRENSLYTSDLNIFKTGIVRARVIRSGHMPGPITTQNYFINETHHLPIVAVNTDPKNLWDNEYGIYVKGNNADSDFPFFGANFWEDWERPANIAMYEPDGSLAFQLDAGIKIFGNYSRGNDQKSISVHARKAYGKDKISYKIFHDKDINEFETFILRNSGNDYNNTMLRDGLCNEIVKSLNLDHQAYRPAVVYINGEYWGIQNIREKVNEEFLAANHGIDKDKIDILEKYDEVVQGNSDQYEQFIEFISSQNLADKQNYAYVKTQMDIENFINYQIAEIFIDNRDWPGNNIKYWREQSPAGLWRWILFDTDFGLNIWSDDNQTYNTLKFALEPNGPDWPNPPWSTLLFRKLVQNQSFKYDFINAFADNLNTIFKSSVTVNLLNAMAAEIEPEISDHLQKWNGYKGYWDNRIAAIRSFLMQRSGFVTGHIKSEFGISGTYSLTVDVEGSGHIQLNTLTLNEFPWTGTYFNNIPVSVTAIPNPGYKFVAWEGAEANNIEQLTLNAASLTNVKAVFEPTVINPNDIIFNEINYNSSDDADAGDWLELMNLTDHAVNVSDWEIKDKDDDHTYIIPENTVIQSHGFLVLCRDKSKFASYYPQTETLPGEMDFGLGSDGDCLRLFTDQGELIDEVCYESKAPWPSKPSGGGASLSLMNALSNNDHPNNWTASTGSGTPGKINDTVTGIDDKLLITDFSTRVYPNPFSNSATIEIFADQAEVVAVSITDVSGRKKILYESYQLSKGINRLQIRLDTSMELNSRQVYILLLESDQRNEHIKVLIQP